MGTEIPTMAQAWIDQLALLAVINFAILILLAIFVYGLKEMLYRRALQNRFKMSVRHYRRRH